MMRRTLGLVFAFGLLLATGLFAVSGKANAELIGEESVRQFSQSNEESTFNIDHKYWHRFLQSAVFDVGASTREPAQRRKGSVHTGTRMSTGSRSRYRFEGNRVFFHLFEEGNLNFIAAYRAGLLDVLNQVDYAELSKDEQLAFWLNLYNVVLMDEIAKRYPISSPMRVFIREAGDAPLFEAKLVTVNGVQLSLDDIRYGIVYRYWDNPDVIYGFWEGTIGGPSIPRGAYSRDNVWQILDALGTRYVNALRGVEKRYGSFHVSEVYDRSRQLFPNWPNDFYIHLDGHAGAEVADLLSPRPKKISFLPYDGATADFANGETASFMGSDNAAAALSLKPEAGEDVSVDLLTNYGAPIRNQTMRGGVTADTEMLVDSVEEKRAQPREGTVSIDDVETEDPGEPQESPEEDEGETDADDGANGSGESAAPVSEEQ